jgi:integrase
VLLKGTNPSCLETQPLPEVVESTRSVSGIGRLIARVNRREDAEVSVVDARIRDEVETLLEVAAEHEPRFSPLLRFLLSTGCRRGEALGLRWEDVDLQRGRVTIRRALTKGISVTPKSGKARKIAMPASLVSMLFDLAGQRRREALSQG